MFIYFCLFPLINNHIAEGHEISMMPAYCICSLILLKILFDMAFLEDDVVARNINMVYVFV